MTTGNTAGGSIDALSDRIEDSWSALMATMTTWPEMTYTAEPDAAGWTALDHMAHVTAWERTWTALLTGRARHEGLRVTKEEFEMEYDPLNEILRARTANDSYGEVLADARSGHEAFLDALQAADVSKLDLGGASLDSLMSENIIEHYDKHREYIEKMLSS